MEAKIPGPQPSRRKRTRLRQPGPFLASAPALLTLGKRCLGVARASRAKECPTQSGCSIISSGACCSSLSKTVLRGGCTGPQPQAGESCLSIQVASHQETVLQLHTPSSPLAWHLHSLPSFCETQMYLPFGFVTIPGG